MIYSSEQCSMRFSVVIRSSEQG